VGIKNVSDVVVLMSPGPVMQLRLVNKAGQPPSDLDATPQSLLKTTSHSRGTVHKLRFGPFDTHTLLQILCWIKLWTK